MKVGVFKDQDHYNLQIEADPHGYCITYSDGSKTTHEIEGSTDENFESAFGYVTSCGYKLREIAQ